MLAALPRPGRQGTLTTALHSWTEHPPCLGLATAPESTPTGSFLLLLNFQVDDFKVPLPSDSMRLLHGCSDFKMILRLGLPRIFSTSLPLTCAQVIALRSIAG